MEAISSNTGTASAESSGLSPVERAPWGFWSTTGLSLAVAAGAFVAQILFGIVWAVTMIVQGNQEGMENLEHNGMFMLTCALFSYPVVIGLTALFIRLRKCDTIAGYLAVNRIGWKSTLPWMGWLVGYLALSAVVSKYLDIPIPSSMLDLGRSSNGWLLFFVVVIVAPVVEEMFFRGFMFKGISLSRIGSVGAILFTTLAWVVIHMFQYSWKECSALFILGLILGAARLKTGSVVAPLVLHMVNNCVALVSLMIALKTGAV